MCEQICICKRTATMKTKLIKHAEERDHLKLINIVVSVLSQ